MVGLVVLFVLSFWMVVFSSLSFFAFREMGGDFFLHFLFLSLLPLWYIGKEYISREDHTHLRVTGVTLILFFGTLVFLGGLLFFFELTLADIVLILTLFFGIFFGMSARYLFLFSLLLLIALAFSTSLSLVSEARVLALYTYYSLVIGVLVEVLHPLWHRFSERYFARLKPVGWWDDYVEEFRWYMDWVVLSMPILFIILLLQYLLRDLLPIAFLPTTTGLGMMVLILYFALSFSRRNIWISRASLIQDILVALAGGGVLVLSFGQEFSLIIPIVLLYVISLVCLSFFRKKITEYLSKAHH